MLKMRHGNDKIDGLELTIR